jgi:UDP-glucose:(heptosyl)LPS alpha-1,3-glucosyltransferase
MTMAKSVPKIAVVIPKYGLVGGAEQFASELTECIAQSNRYEIHVFANNWQVYSDRVTFHKVPIISFPKFLTTISFAYFAGEKIARMKFDLVHTHERIFDADIFTMHGIPHRIWVKEIRKKPMSLFDRATDWVERRLVEMSKCSRFLSVSSLVQDKFLEVYKKVKLSQLQIVQPAVDVHRFLRHDKHECRCEISQCYGIDPDELLILFVSMNFDVKGLDSIIKALGVFKKKFPEKHFKLLVVGKGNGRKYKGLADSLSIGDKVIFTGVQTKEKLERIYMASDLFMMLSKFDTFGMVVLEAMAASLPVIISSNVGAKDFVKQGLNGFVITDIGDIGEIVKSLQQALKEETYIKMGEHAFNTAHENSWENLSTKTMDIYEQCLNGFGVSTVF